ncbi:tigger transposable element-derived protein 2-like [Anopheles funestus]|uniref:tigger transposable element-derived protein 2-like n=1 Tax=Anopheles funestus TaxID=62324 RepID=UPI0020C608EE|nr:tigger transposable element-derived protein 2-like [Anopheles funestus]XP_049277520.1 tigger transposable element-derived protein 2-like [Anopheles funestus]XP_049277521.1 tigger transposable element-derived protein 2-like [Anopheles funestus]
MESKVLEYKVMESKPMEYKVMESKPMESITPAILRRRKKTMLTLAQKISLIHRHDAGETPQDLAKSYQIGEQTARDIIKQRDKIWKFVQNCESSEGPVKRKSMKVSSFEELDARMLSWYNENRTAGIPVTSAMCIDQAKYLHETLGLKRAFNASSGWLSRFKQRYGISGVYTHSTAKGGSTTNAGRYCYQFQQVMQNEDWLPDQIYNVDETGMYWNSLPSKFGSTGSDMNITNERIMVICCTNATGTHKLDLTIVIKSKNPWNLKEEELPQTALNYYEAKGGWVSKEIFRHWFEYKWIPEVREFLTNKLLPLRAILLLDTAPCHITDTSLRSEDGCMVVRFMPTDVANLVQPMQQGIVSLLKWNYRTDLLKQCQNDDKHVMHRKLEDAAIGLKNAWSKVLPQSIKSAWSKLIPDTEQYVVENEIIQVTNDNESCVVMMDHQTGMVMDFEDVEEIEGVEQIEGITGEGEEMDDDIQEDPEGAEEEIQQIEEIEHVSVEQWYNTNEAIIVKEENMVEVAVEFSELNENPDSGDNSGDEGTDKRLELHTALTSVETLLGFVDHRGLEMDDKKAFKQIRADVRKLMKSLELKKNKPAAILS